MENMSVNPLVSVIITTYNRPEFLSGAIETVVKQSYDKIELIIVDDYSTESPAQIVGNTPTEPLQNLKFIRHNENRGASAARNTGVKHSNGKYVALLDDDDRWTSNKIEQQVAKFHESGNEVGVVCTGIKSVDGDGQAIRTRTVEFDGTITKQLLCGAIVPLPSVLVHRNLFSEAGLFDEHLRSCEDLEWMIRLSQHCEFRSVSKPLVISTREGHSQKSDHTMAKVEDGYPLLIERYQPVAAEYGRLFERKMVGHWLFQSGYTSLVNGEAKQARGFIRTAILTWPFALEFYLYGLFAFLGNQWYMRAQNVKRHIERYRHEHTSVTP